MNILKVNIPDREYEILIENGLLDKSGEHILKIHKPSKAAVITDSNVGPLYADRLLNSLKSAGFEPFLVTMPAGEATKSMTSLEFLYDKLLENSITRSDIVIALGGGVIGDLTGFCASTLLRGIPFVQIPTTLLAQVDSSVGGKVAVNLPRGKNLAGTFYQPKLVLIDPLCLSTLTDRVFSDGMAEVIKYGVILDENLFEKLENAPSRKEVTEIIEYVIHRSCTLKAQVVEEDEFDTGKRMILNFGHTYGHAIEKKYNFSTYTHGEAVASGMVMAAKYGEANGITPPGTAQRIKHLVESFNLPSDIEIDKQSLKEAAGVDKKGKGSLVGLILPTKIGEVIIKDTEKDSIWIQ